jgi:hypothetical protein
MWRELSALVPYTLSEVGLMPVTSMVGRGVIRERDGWLRGVGNEFINSRRVEWHEKVTVSLLAGVSIVFIVASNVMLYDLTFENRAVLWMGGFVVGIVMIWIVGGFFAIQGVYRLWTGKTSARLLVDDGVKFFEHGDFLGLTFDREIVRDLKRVWDGAGGWLGGL